MGRYFDKFNFVPLKAVFGGTQIEAYKERLQDHASVEGAMSFYESRPDLTDDPVILWFQVKAQMRVLSMVLTYSEPLGPYW